MHFLAGHYIEHDPQVSCSTCGCDGHRPKLFLIIGNAGPSICFGLMQTYIHFLTYLLKSLKGPISSMDIVRKQLIVVPWRHWVDGWPPVKCEWINKLTTAITRRQPSTEPVHDPTCWEGYPPLTTKYLWRPTAAVLRVSKFEGECLNKPPPGKWPLAATCYKAFTKSSTIPGNGSWEVNARSMRSCSVNIACLWHCQAVLVVQSVKGGPVLPASHWHLNISMRTASPL